ncbi:trehalose-phosphatase [Telmatospirillum sp. J64-1]|uniref:trehalose-phosphatase n=1 Tax=Telmatospirillum sp. J64-1 TaxID=2502183 RepID=UPI00115EEC17|nr:trehalose-phosphatase [Telmatospirillum sp. J64-1]
MLPIPRADWAWFLDMDGTLIEIVPNPDDVTVPPGLVPILNRLRDGSGGALAVVSGRRVETIRHLLAPLDPVCAGLHGLELHIPGENPDLPPQTLDTTRAMLAVLREFAETHPGTFVEDKGLTVGLHYRTAPHHQDAARQAAEKACALASGYQILAGKMVYEIRPDGHDKGTAVETLMRRPPFAGRIPVFIGDDVTDEDGFAVVRRMGGITIRVGSPGERPTKAEYHIESVAALRRWLAEAADKLAG